MIPQKRGFAMVASVFNLHLKVVVGEEQNVVFKGQKSQRLRQLPYYVVTLKRFC